MTISRAAARLVGDTPAIAAAHFQAEADPYHRTRNPDGYLNLGTAENRLVADLLAPWLTGPRPVTVADARYAPLHGTPALRSAIAGLLSRGAHTPVDPEDLIVVSGATAALDIVASVLCEPGDVIVVPAPYYGALDTDLCGRSGARLVAAPLPAAEGFALTGAAVAEALVDARRGGAVVRAVALTSPYNPVGHVYPAELLAEVLAVAAEHDVDVIVDEIYAHCVFGPAAFVSALDPALGRGIPTRVHVVWGFAKDFGLPGLKVGVLHTRSAEVARAARALAYFAPTSSDTQALLTAMLTDEDWLGDFLAISRHRLAASYQHAVTSLTDNGIDVLPAQAGFSVWTDLRPFLTGPTLAAEHELWRRILHTARVNILPGSAFACSVPGWFRLCHTTDRDLVREAVRRLSACRPAWSQHTGIQS